MKTRKAGKNVTVQFTKPIIGNLMHTPDFVIHSDHFWNSMKDSYERQYLLLALESWLNNGGVYTELEDSDLDAIGQKVGKSGEIRFGICSTDTRLEKDHDAYVWYSDKEMTIRFKFHPGNRLNHAP